MAQTFKDIRTKGIAVLTEMSNDIGQAATIEGTPEVRKAFLTACKELEQSEVSHFLVTCALY